MPYTCLRGSAHAVRSAGRSCRARPGWRLVRPARPRAWAARPGSPRTRRAPETRPHPDAGGSRPRRPAAPVPFPTCVAPQARASRREVLMHDAPACWTAVPDEGAAPTLQHLAIRAAPKDRERAQRDFTEAVDADLLWRHPRIGRQRPKHRFLLVLGRREAEQLAARLAGLPAEGPVHGVEGAQCREVAPLGR